MFRCFVVAERKTVELPKFAGRWEIRSPQAIRHIKRTTRSAFARQSVEAGAGQRLSAKWYTLRCFLSNTGDAHTFIDAHIMKIMGAHGPTEWESQMCDAPLIVLLPEVPMTPAIAGRAPFLGPSAWEGPSALEE